MTQKKATKPKASKKGRAKPATTPIVRPSEAATETPAPVLHGDVWLVGDVPWCIECQTAMDHHRRAHAWICSACDGEYTDNEVEQARAEAEGATPGRVVIDQAHVEAMTEDLDALGLDAAILESATGGRRPTDEQIAVVRACQRMNPGDALRIIAYAGAGKTSTLKLCGATIGGGGVYLAFNKTIAQDGQRAFAGSGIASKTTHGLAYGALGLRGELPKQNSAWVQSYVRNGWLDASACADVRPDRQAALTAKAFVKFSASDMAQPTKAHVVAALDDAGFVRPREEPTDRRESKKVARRMDQRAALEPLLLRQVSALWDAIFDGDGEGWQRAGKTLTFDAYLKVFERSPETLKAAFRPYTFVLLDEAQDTNPVQVSIAQQARAAGCKLIAVGDRFQQIYSWRGAVDALEILPGEALYLSASFRFGEAIADFAAASLAERPDGGLPIPLRGLGPAGRVVPVDAVDAPIILCRTNLGVLRTAGGAALKGRTVHVVGGIKDLSDEYQSVLALQDGETHRVTVEILRRFATDNPIAIAAILDAAQARGWTSVTLTGDDAFLRAAVVECVRRGLGVENQEPELRAVVDAERARIEKRRRQEEERAAERERENERIRAMAQKPDAPMTPEERRRFQDALDQQRRQQAAQHHPAQRPPPPADQARQDSSTTDAGGSAGGKETAQQHDPVAAAFVERATQAAQHMPPDRFAAWLDTTAASLPPATRTQIAEMVQQHPRLSMPVAEALRVAGAADAVRAAQAGPAGQSSRSITAAVAALPPPLRDRLADTLATIADRLEEASDPKRGMSRALAGAVDTTVQRLTAQKLKEPPPAQHQDRRQPPRGALDVVDLAGRWFEAERSVHRDRSIEAERTERATRREFIEALRGLSDAERAKVERRLDERDLGIFHQATAEADQARVRTWREQSDARRAALDRNATPQDPEQDPDALRKPT